MVQVEGWGLVDGTSRRLGSGRWSLSCIPTPHPIVLPFIALIYHTRFMVCILHFSHLPVFATIECPTVYSLPPFPKHSPQGLFLEAKIPRMSITTYLHFYGSEFSKLNIWKVTKALIEHLRRVWLVIIQLHVEHYDVHDILLWFHFTVSLSALTSPMCELVQMHLHWHRS